MKNKVFLGIDTSNYTTSCAVCDTNGNIIDNYKVLLPVKDGENGLRQSDAVFAHVKNFQLIAEKIREKHADYDIVAVGYSKYPRDAVNSYMPCFLVGRALAEMISALCNTELFEFSHQKGHVQAAIYSSNADITDKFLAFHVSGGTTEVLLVEPNNNDYKIELVGGSNDLHAGQAIDRIGVKMGLKFPCGREIEALALNNKDKLPPIKVSVSDLSCNLSGLENLAFNLYEKTNNKELVSRYVLEFISKTLILITCNLRKKYPIEKIIYAGGVMSNSIIQENIRNKFEGVYFATPEFSSDNAAGIAILTMKKYLGKE